MAVCERFCDPSDEARCPGCTLREVSGIAIDVCLLPCGEGTPRSCEFDRPCHADSDCESGRCLRPLSSQGLGRGYCSQTCEAAEDCTPSPGPGRPAYACLPVRDERLCIRTCRGSDECPAANVCAGSTGLEPESGLGVCVDLTDDLCGRDADCAADEYCVLHLDEHRALSYCSGFVDDAGRPSERMRVGASCEPRREWPCEAPADCPPAWDCAPLDAGGPLGCRSPPESECALGCLPEGRCTGICEVDADCPAGMRCSMVGHSGLFEERPIYRVCVHAAGSEVPCRGAADCAATGADGAAEDCMPIADAEGNVRPRCVTRTENFVAAGDACGDDPHTAEVEFRACHGACVGDCASFCVSEQDCPAGHACSGEGMNYLPLGAYCLPNAPCFADGDCGEGEVCSFHFLEFGSENWWSACTEARGPLPAGAECPAAPMAFVPVEQRCGWRCADVGWGPQAPRCLSRCRFDADCPEDFLCAQRSYERYVESRRRTEYFGFCEYAPGSRQPCGVTRDCPDGEVCLSSREVTPDGEPQDRSVCTTSIPGGAAIGEPCAPDRPCAGRACQSEGYCGALCGADGDCPAPMVCGWDASGNAGWFCRWPEASPN